MGSKQLGSKFFQRSQICSHTPSALNAGAKRSGATCHMAMPQCCYLAKGAKRPSHTTNTIKFDRIPFDLCNSIKRFDLCPFDQKNSTYLQPPVDFNQDCFYHLRSIVGSPLIDSFLETLQTISDQHPPEMESYLETRLPFSR